MPSIIAQAGKQAIEGHLERYAPADPLYEYYVDEAGKQKRRKAARVTAGIERARRPDSSLCLIPIVGDLTDASLNYYLVVRPSRRAEIPAALLRRMLLNNAFSAGVGLVPFVGDLVLAAFKANSRNAALLEDFLRIRGEEFIRNGGEVVDRTKKNRWFRGTRNNKAYINITEASEQATSSTVQPQTSPQTVFPVAS
ncbi:hypothetical protein D9619_004723 [Psilocybe cf. subviscida]|uniref:Uncharacterized protein n=1 Tax=Psilocybe cf. subviscida TaxID=2480587 RepID=A0A8H5F8I3_9AGAR|nr:hypothetical protein D9619_004723 [Psilocybe cf. subviscida]